MFAKTEAESPTTKPEWHRISLTIEECVWINQMMSLVACGLGRVDSRGEPRRQYKYQPRCCRNTDIQRHHGPRSDFYRDRSKIIHFRVEGYGARVLKKYRKQEQLFSKPLSMPSAPASLTNTTLSRPLPKAAPYTSPAAGRFRVCCRLPCRGLQF